MKKSVLIYLGAAVAAALLILVLKPSSKSLSGTEGDFFVMERVVPFFRGHASPILEQKYFQIYAQPDSTEFFTTISRERDAIDIQPLDGSQHFSIKPGSYIGPDSIKVSIGLLYCYKIVSWDSIFLIDRIGNQVYMADRDGTISNRWTVTDTICHPPSFKLRSYSFSSLSYSDNSLYTSYLPYFNTTEQVFGCNTIAKVPLPADQEDVRINKIFGPYPNTYTVPDRSYGSASILSSFARTSGSGISPTFVISFPKDHNMYLVDEFGKSEAIPAKSDHIQRFKPFDGNVMDNYDNIRYESQEPLYLKIMYDRYRNLYYRIALHRQKYEGPDGTNLALHQKPWSIVVFDEKFQKLDEQVFEAKQFFPKDVFVGKEGLYVSNAKVPDPTTGLPGFDLSFSLFRINPPAL